MGRATSSSTWAAPTLLPRNEIIPGETFKPGDRVQAYLQDVVVSTREPQLYLTRTAPEF